MERNDDIEKALSYAYRLLKLRPRSSWELRGRLLQKRFKGTTARETIDLLKEKHFLDDAAFARSWVESRMNSRPSGAILIRRELRAKGVETELIDEALRSLKDNEASILRDLAEKKLGLLKDASREEKRRRLFGYLAQRGFAFDAIEEVLRDIAGKN